jgi:hypothetical protein
MGIFTMDADELRAVGTGKSSSRLAKFRAAKGLDPVGRKLPHGTTGKSPAQAVVTPAAPSARATIAARPAAKTPAPTAAQIEQARRRARHDAVMNSPQAKGRQCTAAGLLGGAPNLSAEEIIAALPTMPTDAQAVEAARRARAATAWDRAIAANAGKPRPAESQTEGGKAWDRVIARMKQ